MGVTSLPEILVMSLSYLFSEFFDLFLFFLCRLWALGLLQGLDFKA